MSGPLACLCVALLTVFLCCSQLSAVSGGLVGRKFSFKIPSWKSGSGDNEKHVVFYLYTRETLETPEQVDSRHLEQFKTLKRLKPVNLLIHGWKGYKNCTFFREMTQAFLDHGDVNVITVDWSAHGSKDRMYPLARRNVEKVAQIVADFLDFNAATIKLQRLHVLGHSLGAHIAGVAGQLVKKGKIGRISAFDPAGPEFSLKNKSGRLSTDSADFVDVVHTSAHYLGFADPIGHVDFYPNGGRPPQPGCTMDLLGSCSHRRSYMLFKESMTHPLGFPAVPCLDWHQFLKNYCEKKDNNIVYMGLQTPRTARGTYYLITNSATPYGKEKAGLFSAE